MKPYVALIFGVLLLAGCGQRGPLFLPQQTPSQTVPPAQEELDQQPTEEGRIYNQQAPGYGPAPTEDELNPQAIDE